jgi:hypothetical protein
VEEMNQKLELTFKLWPANVLDVLKNDEDRAFIISMQTDRTASFGPRDKKLAGTVKRRLIREKSELERREKYQTESKCNKTVAQSSADTDSDDCLDNTDDVVVESARSHHRKSKSGTDAFIPYNILDNEKLVTLATRLKMTPTQQSAYTEALIQESGGDINKVSTSYATADKARRKIASKVTEYAKENWKAPPFASLHWDSKMMQNLTNQNVSEERLTVIVGNAEELKLLGVPKYQTGTDKSSGKIISKLTTDLLKDWNCVESIVNLTFDTTASNTGHIGAGCIMIQ